MEWIEREDAGPWTSLGGFGDGSDVAGSTLDT